MSLSYIHPPVEVVQLAEELNELLGDAASGVYDPKGGFYASATLGDRSNMMIVFDEVNDSNTLTVTMSVHRHDVVKLQDMQKAFDAYCRVLGKK